MRYWFDENGFPIDTPKLLMEALRKIPGSNELPDDRIRDLALMVEAIANGGRDEELPRNRPASVSASEVEIRKFQDLCGKLVNHIESMRKPSVSALSTEGYIIFDLARELRKAQEIARHAYSGIEGETAGGRPKKFEAAAVTEICASIFEQVSGKRPTFTTDHGTGAVSGAWPDVLQAVFKALYIDASVASQVRPLSEKTREI